MRNQSKRFKNMKKKSENILEYIILLEINIIDIDVTSTKAIK